MIYINKVQTNSPMKEVRIARDFKYFQTCKPQKFDYPADEEIEKKIKCFQMNICIAGQMVGDLTRNNKNVFSRSLLFIDFDDIQETEEEFLAKLSKKLEEVNYCLYPTLKYKPDNIRYRLVLELDRPVSMEEHEMLLYGLCKELDVKFKFDESNRTWSQGQGLPVVTEYSKDVKRIYQDDLIKIPVDKFLDKIRNSKEYKQEIRSKKQFSKGRSKKNTGERKYTGKFLDELFAGAVTGERNNWWREKVDKLLALDTSVETIEKIMICLNSDSDIFPEPLSVKELETIYLSRIKNHAEKGGNIY